MSAEHFREQTQQHTYREQHDGDGQCDGSEDGHTHTQDQSVVGVDAAVGVKELRLHFICRNRRRRHVYCVVFKSQTVIPSGPYRYNKESPQEGDVDLCVVKVKVEK